MRKPSHHSVLIAAALMLVASGAAEATATQSVPKHPAIHPGAAVVRQFALTALQHLKGPAQRPFLSLLKRLPPAKQVGVTISNGLTKNMSCSGGVCTPTAPIAVLNVSQLTRMLVDQSVTIGTSAQAPDIFVNAPFSWTSANGLNLQAIGNIIVGKAVSDAGPAPLTLSYDANGAGGALSFAGKGRISFMGTGNALTINGQGYILANNIQLLAQLIARNPSGNFALSANYNAKHDGTYSQSPIQTPLQGNFEGLGNKITGLHIESEGGQPVGFFQQISPSATVAWINLIGATITGCIQVGGVVNDNQGYLAGVSFSGDITVLQTCSQTTGTAGAIAAINEGQITVARAYGTVTSYVSTNYLGGLVGRASGQPSAHGDIVYSTSNETISAPNNTLAYVGGLVGTATTPTGDWGGSMAQDYFTGTITVNGGSNSAVGGFAGYTTGYDLHTLGSDGSISLTGDDDSVAGGAFGYLGCCLTTGSTIYTTVAVSAGLHCLCGGAVGWADQPLDGTGSEGSVNGGSGSYIGGFIGYDNTSGQLLYDGWCTNRSNITDPSQGAGNIPNDPGITPFTC